ncbi:hypothetical protein D3C80_2167680 [compost metagenome]
MLLIEKLDIGCLIRLTFVTTECGTRNGVATNHRQELRKPRIISGFGYRNVKGKIRLRT